VVIDNAENAGLEIAGPENEWPDVWKK